MSCMSQIKEIRSKTQLPVMECKAALDKTGNVTDAIEFLQTQHRSLPTGEFSPGTVIHLIDRPPYVVQDTRYGVDNRHLLEM